MQVKTNRSFIVYILLTVVTCGIYGVFFWHRYVKDVNTICAGDGKNTREILAVVIFSILTLGIYGFVWTYGMQKRLQQNALRYNAGVIAGGGTVLCWLLFGSLLVGIGSLVSVYIQIDSLNRMAYSYTTMHNKTLA